MPLKKQLSVMTICLAMAGLATGPADAHRRWLLPSATVLSGDKDIVSLDAASSNQLFVFEHRALPLDNLVVTGPDGQPAAAKIIGSGAYRSSFDVDMTQQGTYRIALVSSGLMGSYKIGGESKRWRGTNDELAGAFPEGATDINVVMTAGRTETFATLGAPNSSALAPTGQGLEMVPITHPNDLVVGEPARFKFVIDGKPAADVDIEWVQGGTRYRDAADDMKLKTDAQGVVQITVDAPGMYYLEAAISDNVSSTAGVNARRASYTAVLEFLPL